MVFNRRNSLNCAYCEDKINQTSLNYHFVFSLQKTLSTQVQVKTGVRHESKTSQSVHKDQIPPIKTTRVVFKLSRCLFLPTTASKPPAAASFHFL